MRIVVDILIVISIFFAFAGVVGMLRMPDSFTRMQSSTNMRPWTWYIMSQRLLPT